MSKSRTQASRGEIYEEFGERLKVLRNERNMTQEELAKQIGISRTNIGQYETGVRKVPLNIILQFSEFFGVSVNDLLDINVDEESEVKPVITKYEVATEIGFTKEEISILESDTREIPRSFFEKFANYFNIDINDITALKLENDRKHAVIITDKALSERYKKWQNAIGCNRFTDEEIDQLIDYAKYLMSKRK